MTLRQRLVAVRPWPLLQALLPAALVLLFGFRAGGYFAGTPAFAAVVLAAVLTLRLLVAPRPFEGVSRTALVAIAALALYAIWALVSATWSDAPSRAQVEFDRALLYLLAVLLLVSAPVPAALLRWAVRALAAATVVVCTAGLVSRLLPDVLPTVSLIANERLGYPLTYWNALAVMCAFAVTLCIHLTASAREPRLARVLAAAALPPLAVTLFFTFSRGGIAAAIVAAVAYVIVCRPRLLPTALVAAVPPCAVALAVAYDARLLGTPHPDTGAATAQGHHVALVVVACVAAAALLRWLLLRADDRLAAIEISPAGGRRLRAAAAAGALAAVVVAVALGAPAAVRSEYRGFVKGDNVDTRDFRGRLLDPGNNGRLDLWNVSLDAFRAEPLTGSGAGTYEVQWTMRREGTMQSVEGHSLYLETLAELGVPGLALVLVLVFALLARALLRARGPDRDLYALAFGIALTWALHAGIDWDWEMPAVTIVPLALGALAVARDRAPATPARQRPHGQPLRIVGGIACLLLAVTPATIALSQGHLNSAVSAFRRGDCRATIDAALAATERAGTRPEPFELIGFCDSRLGKGDLAVTALERAVARDPDNWEYRYSLALVRAADGRDPRPSARAALRLNPHEPLTRYAVRGLSTADPARWRAFAKRAVLPAVR